MDKREWIWKHYGTSEFLQLPACCYMPNCPVKCRCPPSVYRRVGVLKNGHFAMFRVAKVSWVHIEVYRRICEVRFIANSPVILWSLLDQV